MLYRSAGSWDMSAWSNSIAMADAKLCDGTCKALHWHLQSFALADAIVLRWQCEKSMLDISPDVPGKRVAVTGVGDALSGRR